MIDLVVATGPDFPWGTATLVAVLWLAGYVIACAVWPWTTCGRCEGGKKRSPSGKAWRNCRRCGGTGKRVRVGRRLWTYASNTRDNSK